MKKLNIGDKVKSRSGWTAFIKKIEYNYAYGLGKRSKNKMYLYTLENENGQEIMGSWSDKNIEKVN